MYKISVIIPVYNAAPYLRQCVDSLLCQTLCDFELILVDDGSSDECGGICDEYSRQDKRIKVIHQPNGGVSRARQTGLNAATGEFVIHADPDDWVDSEMLEDLYRHAKKEHADVVICDFWEESSNGSSYSSQNPGNDLNGRVIAEKIITQQLHGSCCNKLVRRIHCQNISFTPSHLCMWEDLLFCSRLLLERVKVVYLPKAYYHYRTDNDSSACNSFSAQILKSKMDVVQEVEGEEKMSFISTYEMKKNILTDCWLNAQYSLLMTTYTEIHERIRHDGQYYRFVTPLSGYLSLALKSPRWARIGRYLYLLHLRFIHLFKWIKQRVTK